jgi:halogenation protein CepH
MPRLSRDVVIVGGGPAGAVAARLLAGWGHRVLLLTRPDPRRALAESLPPSSVKLLDHVGLRAAMDAAGFVRATGNTVWWGAGDARIEPFGGAIPGYQVLRSRFDRLLLDQAAVAGARVLRRATVREVLPPEAGGGLRRVRFDTPRGPETVAARWVLDCTGRAGLLARHGRRQPERAFRTMALVGVWEYPGGWSLPDPSHTLVESYGEGWAWSVPVSATRRYVTVMVDPALTPLAGRGKLPAAYRAELAKTRHLGPMLRGARRIGRPWARDASPYAARHVGEPGLLLVGDAASFSDPLSSSGVKKAMASAWLAAVVVRSALGDERMTGPGLDLFRRREHAMAESLRRQAAEFSRLAAEGGAHVFWQRRAVGDEAVVDGEPDVAALRDDPEVRAAFQDLKRRAEIRLRPSSDLRREERPAVREDRIVLGEHLVAPAFPGGIRYLRDIDLDRLVKLAPTVTQVPDLFEAYNREAPPVALPDFLGALSVLIGKGLLAMSRPSTVVEDAG